MAYDTTTDESLVDLLLTHGADPTRAEAANGVSPVLLVHRIAGLPPELIDAVEGAARK